MAKLNRNSDSGDELPDIGDLLRGVKQDSKFSPRKRIGGTTVLESPTKTAAQSRRQRPLQVAHVNSLLLPLRTVTWQESVAAGDKAKDILNRPLSLQEGKHNQENGDRKLRSSPRKATAASVNHNAFDVVQGGILDLKSESSSEDHLSDFIVDDSDSDVDCPPPRWPSKTPRRLQRKNESSQRAPQANESLPGIYFLSPEKPTDQVAQPQTPPRLSSEFQLNDGLGHLSSPPRSRTPYKHNPTDRPQTPPSSPPKPQLRSPTKTLHRIPPSPHRPSIDAFWSQDVINDWNDQYSPQKLTSPRKLFPLHEASNSPSSSPKKSPLKSPVKKDKAAIANRKAFESSKHALATTFLQDLDAKITNNRIASMAESTGGIKLIWSKKLNSTAGRANWKREAIRSKALSDGYSSSYSSSNTTTTSTYRHHASIELAEKVIDSTDRLYNVLAHEFCHLANFMISGVKTNPHGKEFKAWAAKATELFAYMGIKVTTTHTYAIAYKYIWACVNEGCGMEFKRHSKSLDPKRHSCGACKGKLLQVQPAPRGRRDGEDGDSGVAMSEYQRFVKGNFGRVRRENPGCAVGEVMRRLGEEFRMGKAEKGRDRDEKRVSKGNENGVVIIDDDDDDDGSVGEEVEDESEADDVVRKLDFLNLGREAVEL